MRGLSGSWCAPGRNGLSGQTESFSLRKSEEKRGHGAQARPPALALVSSPRSSPYDQRTTTSASECLSVRRFTPSAACSLLTFSRKNSSRGSAGARLFRLKKSFRSTCARTSLLLGTSSGGRSTRSTVVPSASPSSSAKRSYWKNTLVDTDSAPGGRSRFLCGRTQRDGRRHALSAYWFDRVAVTRRRGRLRQAKSHPSAAIVGPFQGASTTKICFALRRLAPRVLHRVLPAIRLGRRERAADS